MFKNALKLGQYLGKVQKAARLMIGLPDYDNYLAHHARTHPDQEPMTYEEFFRNRQEAFYGKRMGCC